jgi:hypothetical protein
MTFLHIADSASHLSVGGVVAWIATAVAVAMGAFIVFGLPAIFHWRRTRAASVANRPDGEKT